MLKKLLMVGPERLEEFVWLSAQGWKGWNTTAVNPRRTFATNIFVLSGGRFIQGPVEDVVERGERFDWTHESFPQPLGRNINVFQRPYEARLKSLALGGRLTMLTEDEDLIDMYRALTTPIPNVPSLNVNARYTFSESKFTPAHSEARSLPPARSGYVVRRSPVWLLDIRRVRY